MRAKSFAAWAEALEGERVEVRIAQIIEEGSLIGRLGVGIYNFIQRRAPLLHNIYWHIVEVIAGTHEGRVSFGGSYYRRLVADWRPHAVLSVHDSTNRGFFEDARRVLGEERVFCATYCGEWTGGEGFSHNWVNPTVDLYGARTEEARSYAIELGVPRKKTRLLRKFLPPETFSAELSPQAIKQLRADLCRCGEDRFTVFLATGGFGANHHTLFLRALYPLRDVIQVLAVCGRNERALADVREWCQRHPDLPVHFEGYSERVHHYLQAADCVVTRGGANTTAEAVHFGCPVIFDTLGGVMPQERLTIRFLEAKGAAAIIRRAEDLVEIVGEWAKGSTDYTRRLQRIRKLSTTETPEAFVREILHGARSRIPGGKAEKSAADGLVAIFSGPSCKRPWD
jgi:processive 1,2-diacylglycerol beta-glucosyltransferase